MILLLHLADLTGGNGLAFHRAITPVDTTGSLDPSMWSLLHEVRRHVPAGATVTTAASNPQDAFYLYMCAVGVLEDNRVLPGSYYSNEYPQHFPAADYVVFFGSNGHGGPRQLGRLLRRTPAGYLMEVQE